MPYRMRCTGVGKPGRFDECGRWFTSECFVFCGVAVTRVLERCLKIILYMLL